MALVRKAADRYNSTEHRSSITNTSKSSRTSSKTNNLNKAKSAVDSNNNNNNNNNNNKSTKASAVESASSDWKSNSSNKNRSSIPIRRGSASPPKYSSPTQKEEDLGRRVADNQSFEAEDSEETPKLQRKVKKRLVRKPNRRSNAVVGQGNANRNGRKSNGTAYEDTAKHSSESEQEFSDENSSDVRAPSISIINQAPVTATKPLKITYRTPTSTDDDSRKQRRNRDERPKTLPITFTVRPVIAQGNNLGAAEQSDEDTLTSGAELSEGSEKRTSIRIVSSSARSSDTEESAKKLHIEAKSFKRKATKDEEFVIEREARLARANAIYSEKTRSIIAREARQNRKVEQSKLQRIQLQDAESVPGYARTLPRNFKTVRVPIQAQQSPRKEEERDQKRRSLQPIDFRPSAELPAKSTEHNSGANSPSVSSTKSYDLSPTVHQCRRGCTQVVDDTLDGPRIIRRSREKRRESNPNQILGRTEIQALNKGRPNSGLARSSSLPRSSERPRVKSTAFEEFVEIHDLGEFSRSKSRTLPHRKKRVTYHEGVKDDFHAYSESEAQNEEFQRHLLIHQSFTENASKRLIATKNSQILDSDRKDWVIDKQGTQERAPEIHRSSRENTENTSSFGFQDSREIRNHERKVGAIKSSEAAHHNYTQRSEFKEAELRELGSREVKGQLNSQQQIKGERNRVGVNYQGKQDLYSLEKRQQEEHFEKKKREVVKEEVIEEYIKERRLSEQKEQKERRESKIVTRSQTLPRKANREEYQDQKQQEFEEFIRNQRNLLLNQLYKREESQEQKVKGQGSKNQSVQRPEEYKDKKVINESLVVPKKVETENSGRRIDEILVFPDASKNKRRHKSTNDANSIKEARFLHQNLQSKDQRSENSDIKVQRSHSSVVKSERSEDYSKQKSHFLLQNNQEAKALEQQNSNNREDIIRVFSRGGVIHLIMESVDRERFEQRQREYEALQKRRSQHQHEQRLIDDDRYRYINNDFDMKSNGLYYNDRRYDPGNRNFETYHSSNYFAENDDVFEERRDTKSTQVTRIKEDQVKGQLDRVHYTICTHYFYPEDHELIVNLHRLGKIEVPSGLTHRDTCIFYNHLYVYEKEEVFAETLAPILPTIKAEVVNLDEQMPEDETMSEHSSANQSYNDDTSSQYSSSSRRERNLYSSLKAQKYYDAKQNNNNEDSIDFGFDSTYETLRRKRKSYNDDDDLNRYGANSPGSSSGKSDFTYSKPRLLRRSEEFPGVGREVEDDYPRWTPRSPTPRERDYGLSVALPP